MIFLIAPYNHRITFDQRILIQRHRSTIVDELLQIRFIFRLHQLHHISILYFKLENMLSLFYNRIFCHISTLHYKRIASNVEVDRLTGRIRIINRVALNAKRYIILIVIVQPNALQHFLSRSIFLYLLLLFGLLTTSNKSQDTAEQP